MPAIQLVVKIFFPYKELSVYFINYRANVLNYQQSDPQN